MPGYRREGKMRAKLRAAIFDGFNPASLDQILSDNDRLQPNIAIGPDFGTRVNSLIDVARREGWLIELCGMLAAARVGNEAISSKIVAVQKWLIEHPPKEIDYEFQDPATLSKMSLLSVAIATVVLIGIVAWITQQLSSSIGGSQSPAVQRTEAPCSPVFDRTQGNVTVNISGGCTAGISPLQLREIKDAVQSGRTIPPELLERNERLARQFGVSDTALENFLRILGERKIPIEDLDAKLREIAEHHLKLLKQVETLSGEDPQVASIKKEAVAAIGAGDYARAQSLLEQAYDADLVAARKVQDAANRRFVSAAKTKADLGQMKLSQLQYAAAAREFVAAADLVPMSELLLRAQYLALGGVAWRRAGAYPLADLVLTEALRIQEGLLAPDHMDLARSLVNLASLYTDQGRYAQAEPLVSRALAIREKALGAQHPDVASTLNILAELQWAQGRNAEAEPLLKRALTIDEKAFGPDHPYVATDLNNLAALAKTQGRYAEAEQLTKRVLAIDEKTLGPEHPSVAVALNNLAAIYRAQGRNAEAEPLYKRALAIGEKTLGAEHPKIAVLLGNLSVLYQEEGRSSEAESVAQRALIISEKALGPQHPQVAVRLDNLAGVYTDQGRHAEAEPLAQRALAISERAHGRDHPDVATRLINLAALFHKQGRYPEAEPLAKRALAIREKALGLEHPDVAIGLNNLARLYVAQGRAVEAEPLYQRALAVREKALGVDHPDSVTVRRELQMLQQSMPRAADGLRGGQPAAGAR
jgi:tetratricopeptide (TPR) repeat protein